MIEFGLPVLYALLVWWFSTGLIAYLDGLPRHTFRWSMLGSTILAVGSLYMLAEVSTDTSITGAYVGFTAALVLWGWHEMSFLLGIVTGPRRIALPVGSRGLKRLGYALAAIAWHELGIAASAVLVVLLTWGGENQVGTWTFFLLWGLRVSAKLNVFLGVPNLSEEFLPSHLTYLSSYFRQRPMNLLFPVSVTTITVGTLLLCRAAIDPFATDAELVGFSLLAALTALALLEHWLMVLPISAMALWGWYLGPRATETPPAVSNTAERTSRDPGFDSRAKPAEGCAGP